MVFISWNSNTIQHPEIAEIQGSGFPNRVLRFVGISPLRLLIFHCQTYSVLTGLPWNRGASIDFVGGYNQPISWSWGIRIIGLGPPSLGLLENWSCRIHIFKSSSWNLCASWCFAGTHRIRRADRSCEKLILVQLWSCCATPGRPSRGPNSARSNFFRVICLICTTQHACKSRFHPVSKSVSVRLWCRTFVKITGVCRMGRWKWN